MIPYTQTLVGRGGNCLQTSIECILEVPQGSLPPQEHPVRDYYPALNQALARYGLVYGDGIRPFSTRNQPGWHVMVGVSPRTMQIGALHAVVGWNGALVWDPHPSRDGLCTVESWGILLRI
jgi:hypothetical protein